LSTLPAGTCPVEQKSACQPSCWRTSPVRPRSKGWASYESSRSILTGFTSMSAGLSAKLDWLPRFDSNWTHRAQSAPELPRAHAGSARNPAAPSIS
jgi:hypothetical protein